MISQADILKTLINNNCTDESVMSTALSPDCTPPKLMEKLTEAERFDLALDISMKLGLDVIPMWRTWAMRCLKNRNFQGARDKFRHCFLRLRLPGGRTSPMQGKLLADILTELTKMDEVHPPLCDEIEMIKQRDRTTLEKGSREQVRVASGQEERDQDVISEKNSVLSKPKIYAECMHYLTNYGSVLDRIRFYARNSLWDEAVQILLEKSNQINLDKFFTGEVLTFSTSVGCLSDLIAAFLQSDPSFALSAKYFKAIYGFCLRNRRYHVLYYTQTSIGDYIAAANTQINHFFLKRPVKSYRELNQRISSLILARDNYRDSLDKSSTPVEGSDHTTGGKQSSSLFTFMPPEEVHSKIKLIDLQIDITRNFSINEVSGNLNGLSLAAGSPDNKASSSVDIPVTLFDTDVRRKTFLTALVLIYFDLSCSSYFSKNGLELANQLIKDYSLDKLSVYKTTMQILIDDESCDILENATLLLERIKEDYLSTQSDIKRQAFKARQSKSGARTSSSGSVIKGNSKSSSAHKTVTFEPKNQPNSQSAEAQIRAICDDVIRDSIGSCKEPDYKMELAKLLSGEAKIELYIEQGKLSNAQRLACNMNRPDYVISIIEEAGRLNQNHVKTVCQLWLAKHETKNPSR